MPIPKQIERANAKVDEMIAQMKQGPADQPPAPVEAPPAPQDGVQPPIPAVQPEPVAPTGTPPESQPDTPPSAPPPPEQGDELRRLQEAHRTLQGKYNAETRELREENRDLRRRNDALQDRLANIEREIQSMRAKPASDPNGNGTQPPGTTPAASADVSALLPQERVDELGEDLVQDMARIAAATAQREVSRVQEQLQPLRESDAQIARHLFFRDLTTRIPNWQQQNSDAGFLNWLGSRVGPRTWQSLLDEAVQACDADAVVEIFSAYPGARQAVQPAPTPPPAPAPAPAPAQPKPSSEVVPKQAPRAPAPSAPEKHVYTRDEVRQIATDITRGHYTREQAQKLQADLDAAFREGRLR